MKAIIFDWGGVLIDFPTEEVADYCGKKLGIHPDDFLKAYKKFEPDLQIGKIGEAEVLDQICDSFEVARPKNRFLYKEAFSASYRPRQNIFKMALKLQRLKYKVGFLSNTERMAMDFFNEQSYTMFDKKVFSCATKVAKPDSKIYFHILNELGVKAHEAILIDDNDKYIQGAKKIGINTILFKDAEQTLAELALLGIKINNLE